MYVLLVKYNEIKIFKLKFLQIKPDYRMVRRTPFKQMGLGTRLVTKHKRDWLGK